MTAGAPLLEVDAVSVRRDDRSLLERVSLTVAPGTIHVLVGPNGGGKSTLVSAILGQTPFTGQILFRFRGDRRLGYVPQVFEADRTLPLTVAELLALARQRWPVCLGLTRHARTRAAELLARVGLPGFGDRRLGTLSGGELRRVLLANALDPRPEMLLCDEPASGLDPAAIDRLDEILLELRRAGTAVLLVSHHPHEVRRVADRVTLLDRVVVAEGTADEVLTAARTREERVA